MEERRWMKGVSSHQQGMRLKSRPKVRGLDGLKGIAIIGVTLFHMFPDAVSGGFIGVTLFFVITGYLLAYTSCLYEGTYRKWLVHYFQQRLKRVYPPLLLMLLVTLGLFTMWVPSILGGIHSELISIVLGYNNWWQIWQNSDYFTRLVNTSPYTHMWFLGVEIQYFFIWAILFGLYRWLGGHHQSKMGMAMVGILGVLMAFVMPLLYGPHMDFTRLYYGTDTRVYALLWGAYMGMVWASRKRHSQSSSSLFNIVGIVGVCLGLVVAYAMMDGSASYVYEWGMTAATLLCCILVRLVEYSSSSMGKLLDNTPLGWLGKRSYGLFLWQYPIIYLFEQSNLLDRVGSEYAYYALMIVAILLLTTWSEAVTEKLNTIDSFSQVLGLVRKYYLRGLTYVASLCMVVGVFGLYGAPTEKIDDLASLQARLEANAASQAEDNKNPTKTVNVETVDISKVDDPEEMHHITAIGDSVMLGSAHTLRKEFPGIYIDAKVSRYVGQGVDIANALKSEDKLGHVVVIGLGSNGPLTGQYESLTKDLVDIVGSERKIFWVNNYAPKIKWIKGNNEYLDKLAAEHPNITIIDWADVAAKHPEWLAGDRIHPNDIGAQAYAKLLHDTIKKSLLLEKQGKIVKDEERQSASGESLSQ